MLKHGSDLAPPLTKILGIGSKKAFAESIPDIVDRLLTRMEHVTRIESIVAEFVHQDLERGKTVNTIGAGSLHQFSEQTQLRFAQ